MIINLLNHGIVKIKKRVLALNKEAHQLTNTTKEDRYPEIFNVASSEVAKTFTAPKILSFGCSTGEECITADRYFKHATIIGADINKNNLKICQKKYQKKNIKFIYSDYDALAAEAPFNVIFCMSVLCRWEDSRDVDDITELYCFDKFEATITKMDSMLSKDGLLIIYNSNFRFSDCSIFSNYEVISDPSLIESGFVHKFGKNNIKLKDQNYPSCIFRKKK